MKNENLEPIPDTENAMRYNTPVENERMWEIVLKDAEESLPETNRVLNLAFIY